MEGKKIKWYCQLDGGQWNVRVCVLHELTIAGKPFMVIIGKDLVGVPVDDLYDVLLVHSRTVTDIAQ